MFPSNAFASAILALDLAYAAVPIVDSGNLVASEVQQEVLMVGATPASTGTFDANEVLEAICQSYSGAVNASDAVTYAKLFTEDAIRMPPEANPEYGREQIQRGEQADYDIAQ